jgi:branched-subunit amino acid ABC-type transport system permease component
VNLLLPALIGGIAYGVPVFLASSGLTLVYGVLRVLNFAHGGMLMLGAYLFVWALGGRAVPLWEFIGAVIAAGLVVGILGIFVERGLFHWLYGAGTEVSLLGSYGLLLFLTGIGPAIWGNAPLTQALPVGITGKVSITGSKISYYELIEVGVGIVVALALFLILKRTRLGMQATAVAEDREMARALGVRAAWVSGLVFVLGSFLAGLAGAVVAPTTAVSSDLASSFILTAFAAVIIGGLGSVEGALIAAVGLGIIDSLCVTYLPSIEPYSFYIVLAIMLVLRPQGLLGRRSALGQF